MSFAPMTVQHFVSTYDRDCLILQYDAAGYINELESEIMGQYPDFVFYDSKGIRVWPVALLKGHFGITGEPLWPEPNKA